MAQFLEWFVFHWTPERAIYIGGQSLSWDARCAGIYMGIGIGVVVDLCFRRGSRRLPSPFLLVVGAVTMVGPAVVDILSVGLRLATASNDLRLLTGMLFGGYFSLYLCTVWRSVVLPKSTGPRVERDRPNVYWWYAILCLAIAGAFLLRTTDGAAAFYVLCGLSFIGFGGMLVIFGGSIVCAGCHLLRGISDEALRT